MGTIGSKAEWPPNWKEMINGADKINKLSSHVQNVRGLSLINRGTLWSRKLMDTLYCMLYARY